MPTTSGIGPTLMGNPVQSDGKAFFSTDHKNYLTGADTALSVDGLTQAEVTFGEQVSIITGIKLARSRCPTTRPTQG